MSGGHFSIWNKVSNKLKKLKNIDTADFVKKMMLEENDTVMNLFDKDANLRIKIPDQINDIKNDVKEYITISRNLAEKLGHMQKMLNYFFPNNVNIDIKYIDQNILNKNLTKKKIIESLQSNQEWLKNLAANQDVKNSKNISTIAKLSNIDVNDFEKQIEDIINERENNEKNKSELEKNYKENILKEIENHKQLINKIMVLFEKLEKWIPKNDLEDALTQANKNNWKVSEKFENKYKDAMEKIEVNQIEKSDTDTKVEKIQFLIDVFDCTQQFKKLIQKEIPDYKSVKFEFSKDSITEVSIRAKQKRVYTLNDKLIIQNYASTNNKLLSKLTIKI